METILTTLAASVLLGALGQSLASLLRIPAIVFLLVLGVLAGPQVAGLVEPIALGDGLRVLTACFVAIILFEGGLSLPPHVLLGAITPVRRLVTVGAVVTMIGAACACRLFIGLPWSQSLLFGSLVIVTGPTVVTPILKRVRLEPRLAAILKSEGILIDAVGAVAAVVMLEYTLALEASFRDTFVGLAGRLGIGLFVGGSAGAIAVLIWRLPLFHEHENEHLVHLGALGAALASFAVAEQLRSEAGIMAAMTAGLVLAASPIPFRDKLEEFKEHLTTLGVSVLFVLLAANINWQAAAEFGWAEAGVMATLMFVVRPASVWISTWGTELSWREKTYLSLLAPRGIVAAAMASHFAVELQHHGMEGAATIESLVFLTIAVTVCLQGVWANWLARALDVKAKKPTGVMIVGVNTWSLVLAEALRRRDMLVRFVDLNPVHCQRAREEGFDAVQGDASDEDSFEQLLDLSDVGTLVAMTSNDAVNTLACDAAIDWLGRGHVLQVLSSPVDGEPRAKVRMSGDWAMPSSRSHHSICSMLRRETLQVAVLPCGEDVKIERDMSPSAKVVVPLLVIAGEHVRVAAEGETCPTNSELVALVEA
ncbi:MAG: sodium:proton antiporter [Pirellulales bacterium]